ncbi:recombinase family protein [Methylolobus aquaticus]|nr:recombinase family protein [Methylolobus aquaticus]
MNAAVLPHTGVARKRCAVYTRKSTDEGLDQAFNSIDAQREAGQAYIASQRAEGWIPVTEDYDDPAYSGGNMERPALKRLLADIERGQIDIVVVYKLDRLSRSLADFARMVEIFDRHGVSFSAVTQQLNSATSMGRLMLNVLLSFAQFEREVTGERIRDKIAASKRKGLWMGGVPPLGYDVVNRQLVINQAEAAIVRCVFEDMLTLGSTTRIAAALNAEGKTTKAWTTQEGRRREGTRFDKKYLYKLLRNRIYLGELSHRGTWFPGQHDSIVDAKTWAAVHAVLAVASQKRAAATQAQGRTDALLRGLLFDATGGKMHPTFTRKPGRAYRYYISKAEKRFGAAARTCERIPADAVETATVAQIKTVLSSPEAIAAVCRELEGRSVSEDVAVLALTRLGDTWDQLFPVEQHRLVNLMIERIHLVEGGLKITWRALGWKALLGEFAPNTIGAEQVAWEAVA